MGIGVERKRKFGVWAVPALLFVGEPFLFAFIGRMRERPAPNTVTIGLPDAGRVIRLRVDDVLVLRHDGGPTPRMWTGNDTNEDVLRPVDEWDEVRAAGKSGARTTIVDVFLAARRGSAELRLDRLAPDDSERTVASYRFGVRVE